MNKCYLCSTKADISGGDYGRKKFVHCPECGYYEVSETAIKKLENDELPSEYKVGLIEKIKQIHVEKKVPVMV